MNEIEALVELSCTPYIGPIKIQLLLRRFGSASAALEASQDELKELPGFGPKVMQTWRKCDRWKRELELAHRMGVTLLPASSPHYPKNLLELSDHPALLYIKGSLKPQDMRGIAVIGTRNASIYGLEAAAQFGRDLAAQGLTVVSGLARGIDTAAHKGALDKGRTVAVIGSGLANIYPHENAALAAAIEEQGALISEFPMTTPPDRQNFPQRNRIVSGMTRGTLLIEAPEISGAMLTAGCCLEQKRKLFALPGRIDSENFRGNHLLIKQNKARLVENVPDILEDFQELFQTPKKSSQPTGITLEEEERHLLDLLPNEEISFESLQQRSKLPVRKLTVLIMSLLLKRVIKEYPGKLYTKARK